MWKTFYCFIYFDICKNDILTEYWSHMKISRPCLCFLIPNKYSKEKNLLLPVPVSNTCICSTYVLKSPVNGSSNSILQHRVGLKNLHKDMSTGVIWIKLWSTTKLINVHQFGSWSDYYSNYISVAFNGTIYKNIFFLLRFSQGQYYISAGNNPLSCLIYTDILKIRNDITLVPT